MIVEQFLPSRQGSTRALHVRLEKNLLNDYVRPIIRWQSTNDFVLSLGWVHELVS